MKRLHVCVEDSRQGDGPANDDVAGHLGGAAWVIDGATCVGRSLSIGPSDAAWYAPALDGSIRRRVDLDGMMALSTAKGVDEAMRLQRRLELDEGSCRRHPRAKRMDDATVSVIGLVPA